MRDKGRFNKDLTVVYQQPLSCTNVVVVPIELIARREEPESSMAVLDPNYASLTRVVSGERAWMGGWPLRVSALPL